MLRLANATAHISTPAQGRQLSYRDPLVEALLKDAEPAVAAFASLEIEPAEITHPPESLRGTEGSNPPPSSAESANYRFRCVRRS